MESTQNNELPSDLHQDLMLYMERPDFDVSTFRHLYSEIHDSRCVLGKRDFIMYLSGPWFSEPTAVFKWRLLVNPSLKEEAAEEVKEVKEEKREPEKLVPYKYKTLTEQEQCFIDSLYEFLKTIHAIQAGASRLAAETDFFVALLATQQVYVKIVVAIGIDPASLFEIFDALFAREHLETSTRSLYLFLEDTVAASKPRGEEEKE
jgi:hypothetical protein